MACDCTTYECLETVINLEPCADSITLKLPADETGTWLYSYEFNERWFGGSVEVENGVNIVLPFTFNEHYRHTIKFYNSENELWNNTCYTLDTSKIVGVYAQGTVSVQENIFNVTVEEDGSTVTSGKIAGRNVMLVADGAQVYNRQPDNFTQTGNSFTMTNGVSFAAGQILTITVAH